MNIINENGGLIIELPKESEIFMIDECFEKIKEAGLDGKNVVVDFKNVESIDTTFIQLVVSMAKTAKHSGSDFDLQNMSDDVKSKFSLFGYVGFSEE